MTRSAYLAGVALAVLPVAAHAQSHPPVSNDIYHDKPAADIVVTAPFARDLGTLTSGVSIVSGSELTRSLRPTIGETLARQPGVSSTSFGPNASRPVLRGFQGERVRILTDGIGSFDVSNTSVDHAVAINPLTAERIEVLRGPSALLFGSSAIGGVVNVIDGRIPLRIPDEPIHVDAIGTYGSAADERSFGGKVEAPIGDKVVVHFDGTWSKTDDLRTGGYILPRGLREEAAASDEAEIQENARLRGKLPNSSGRTWEVAGGAALITETGNLGFSVSRLESRYGVPSRLETSEEAHDHDHEHEEGEDHGHEEEGHSHENVRLDMRQTRVDLRGEVETGGGILEKLRLRAGYADYRHDELEETGEIGTSFFNDSYEARLEAVQAQRGGWRGGFGAQMFIRNFNVIGEEKFLPKNETVQTGLFTLQEFDLGPVKAEAGGRWEHTKLTANADADLGNGMIERSFDAFSGSIGASYEFMPDWRIGLNGSRSERAPSAEELFANGPHAGTQSFEIGNPDFAKEKSWGLEATLRGRGAGWRVDASAYHSWFKNYIFETQTGEEIDELPVYQFAQADARYYGFEIEGSANLARFGSVDIVADALADYVRAKVVGTGPVPRIPPLRLLGGIEAQAERVQGRVEVEWTDDQDRVAAFETPTEGYTMVNASVSFQPIPGNKGTTLMLSANNIFDVVARRHASFLKDYAPLAGRDIRVSARVSF